MISLFISLLQEDTSVILLLLVILFFVGGGWFIGKIIQSAIPKSKNHCDSDLEKPSSFITHNYIQETHNHLHISDKDLKELTQNKK